MRVWKYPLEVDDQQVISMPEGTMPLCVQVQQGTPCLWAKVNPSAPKRDFTIITVGTGHDFDDMGISYAGTYQLHGGHFVGHVFVVV